jgi:hypothetical protein
VGEQAQASYTVSTIDSACAPLTSHVSTRMARPNPSNFVTTLRVPVVAVCVRAALS